MTDWLTDKGRLQILELLLSQLKTQLFASTYDNSSYYRPHAQEVNGEGRDEEACGQVEELGSLLDQACGVPDVDESEQ